MKEHTIDELKKKKLILRCVTPLEVQEPDSDVAKPRSSQGDKVCAMTTSAVDFKRTLEFFGYKWVHPNGHVKKSTSEVTTADIKGFIELFEHEDLSTRDGFRAFIEKFRLEALFDFALGTKMWRVQLQFGIFLRSFVPLRLTAFDGMRRASCCSFALTSINYPTNYRVATHNKKRNPRNRKRLWKIATVYPPNFHPTTQ